MLSAYTLTHYREGAYCGIYNKIVFIIYAAIALFIISTFYG